MALIALADCKVLKKLEGSFADVCIITPATADSNDTIDVTTLVRDGEVLRVDGWDVEGGDEATATYNTSTGVITIDAAGGTTDHTYAIHIKYIGENITP